MCPVRIECEVKGASDEEGLSTYRKDFIYGEVRSNFLESLSVYTDIREKSLKLQDRIIYEGRTYSVVRIYRSDVGLRHIKYTLEVLKA